MLCCGREVESRQGAGRAGSAGSGAVRCGAVRVGVWRRLACCGAACVPWVGLGMRHWHWHWHWQWDVTRDVEDEFRTAGNGTEDGGKEGKNEG
jgi:hypothetical protein